MGRCENGEDGPATAGAADEHSLRCPTILAWQENKNRDGDLTAIPTYSLLSSLKNGLNTA